jgi:hypothetical protein
MSYILKKLFSKIFLIFLIFDTSFLHAKEIPTIGLNQITGQKFYETCNSKGLAETSLCLGYTMGLSDGLSMLQMNPLGDFKPICIPTKATAGQQRDVIVNYLANNPAIRHHSIGILSIAAWRNAWPCL